MSWVEDKNQRIVGVTDFRQEHLRFSMTFFIGPDGQLRSRFTNLGRGVSFQDRGTGSNFSAEFRGHSLITTQGQTLGARRIEIHFNSGYNACNARVIEGKQAGASVLVTRNVEGQTLEVRSTTVSETRCSVQNGNALGQ